MAMKIGQIRKWTSREMDQSLEEEHFVAKNPVKQFRNYSRKSGTDKKSLQKRVQTIRKVRILVENAIKSILKKSGVIRKEDDKKFIKEMAFHFVSLSNYENNFSEAIQLNPQTKDWSIL